MRLRCLLLLLALPIGNVRNVPAGPPPRTLLPDAAAAGASLVGPREPGRTGRSRSRDGRPPRARRPPARAPRPGSPGGSRCRIEPARLVPGGVALLSLDSSGGLVAGEVVLGERRHPLEPAPDGRTLWGLVALDLDAEPPRVEGEVRVVDASGGRDRWAITVPVDPGRFEVDRLSLPEAMVNPPPEVAARIEAEEAMLERIYDQRTPRAFVTDFVMPVAGSITSSFGRRRILNGEERSPHSGTDIRAPVGRPVHASNTGRVVLVRDLYFSGTTVVLDHGHGLFTQYAHLSRTFVEEGDLVLRRQRVGEVGATGRATGPHLHWGLRLAGARASPLALTRLSLARQFPGLVRDPDTVPATPRSRRSGARGRSR